MFVDSDDSLELEMIEILIRNISKYSADISCCQYNKDSEYRGKTIEVWDRETGIKQFLIHQQINGSLVNKLIKQEVIGQKRLDITV